MGAPVCGLLHSFLDAASSEIAVTPLFARNMIHTSYDHTPVMGSRDALLSATCTPSSVRAAANSRLPPQPGQKLTMISRGIESSSLRRNPQPHTIVIEGTNGLPPSPTRFLSQRHYV